MTETLELTEIFRQFGELILAQVELDQMIQESWEVILQRATLG